jgi:transcriptional regulator with GAF, ATPase, and Fis domain
VPSPDDLRAALDRLTRSVGRKPLDALLVESRAIVERHLIGAALDRCSGDAVLAAELLGTTQADLARRSRRGSNGRGARPKA